MLNRIRLGETTDEDLKILNGRPASLLSKKEYNEAIHLFYTNLEVNEHNISMLNLLEGLLEEISANLMAPKGYKPKFDKGLVDNTQFAEKLRLKKSARVMIIVNVDIKDSIVNESLGTVIHFVKTVSTDKDGNKKEEIRSIIVVFDDPETGLDQMARHQYDESIRKHKEARGVPIFRSTLSYQAPYKKKL